MAESYYRRRMRRLLAEGFTPSQARGHPKPSEPSVRQVREAAAAEGRPIRTWLARFFADPPAQWRTPEASPEQQAPIPPPPPIQILPPEELAPPSERGFVVGPVFDSPYQQKAYDFGFINDDGEVVDPVGADLLYRGWYDFQDMDPIDLADIRSQFFTWTDYSWQDFDDWREYISEYLGAA